MKLPAIAAICLSFAFTASALAAGVADHVSVENATARAVAPGVPVSGAYMSLATTDGADHVLIAARSDAAESVELHNHVMEDGMMKMRKMETVALPAGTTVAFEPGGLHVMLIGLTGPLAAGDQIGIELEFEDGSRKPVIFDVK